jgi:hypothetical protein
MNNIDRIKMNNIMKHFKSADDANLTDFYILPLGAGLPQTQFDVSQSCTKFFCSTVGTINSSGKTDCFAPLANAVRRKPMMDSLVFANTTATIHNNRLFHTNKTALVTQENGNIIYLINTTM